jgi:hypothetical protein
MNKFNSNRSKQIYYLLISIFLVSCGNKTSQNTNKKQSENKVLKQKTKPIKTIKPKTIKSKTITKTNDYKLGKISEVDFTKLLKKNIVHSGMVSPDKKVNLKFVEIDPTYSDLTIKRKGKKPVTVKGYHTKKVFWSKDSSRIALVNTDDYAGDGDYLLVVYNLETMKKIRIDLSDFAKNIKTGGRWMFSCSLSGWQDNKTLIFQVSVNYHGESGHPGINSNRKRKMGNNFNKNDPIHLGSYIISLK